MLKPSNAGPYFGLKVRFRAYACIVCEHEQTVSTNHTDVCFARCPGCSWKGHFSAEHGHYLAGTDRPMRFVGEPPQPSEVNRFVQDARQPQFDDDEMSRGWVEGYLPHSSIRVVGRNELPLVDVR